MARTRQRSRFPFLLLLLMFALVCLVSLTVVAGVDTLPRIAQTYFGPPAAELSAWEKFLTSARLLLNRSSLLEPVDTSGTPVPFTIEEGESPNSVSFRMEEDGLVRSAETFRQFLIYSGIDRRIQAGTYKLSPAQPALEIARQLQDATPEEVQVTVLPGWRSEEIAASLRLSGLTFTPNEFLHLVRNYPAEWLPPDWPSLPNVEGYLAPGDYTFSRQANAEEVVRAFVDRFIQELTPDLRQGFERQGLTLPEAVVLASIVEKEGMVADEHPLIASVFYNRLQAGMKLDSDPTVQYAIGFDQQSGTWWKNPLRAADLQTDSPFNTYLYTGLPPAPICSPGTSALTAVAYPAQTPYYYFRARCDNSGRHEFAATYDEHLQNACP